jgi:2-phosphoglycerate kinase
MVYLIGGPPRSGKTILAETLAGRTSRPYFSLDHVTSVIVPYIPEPQHPTRLPLRIARLATEFSNDAFYARYSIDEIIGMYVQQAETCWSGVENFIKYAVEDRHDLILEGWQLLPHLLATAVTPENQDALRILFLYKTNVEMIARGLKASTAQNDWATRNSRDESTFLAIATMLSRFGKYTEAEAGKYGFRALNTESHFGEAMDEAMKTL